MKKNANLLLMIGLVVAIIAIGVGASYAYFTAVISGAEEATTINIGASTISIAYASDDTIVASNIVPGWQSTKEFTVTGKNPTNISLLYNVNLIIDTNGFNDQSIVLSNTVALPEPSGGWDYLNYQLTSTGPGACSKATTEINPTATLITMCEGSFASGANMVEHTYSLTISYPNRDYDQSINQGKLFKARIEITSNTQFSM